MSHIIPSYNPKGLTYLIFGIGCLYPPFQTIDSCSYAATALHISYNLVICYLRTAVGPIPLPPGIMLVNYVQWERDIIAKVGQKLTFVWYLLEDAKLNGVPLWSGPRVKIDQRCHFNLAVDVRGDSMRQQLNCSKLVAVFNIHEDYDVNGEQPYMDRKGVLHDENGDERKHAVVIVGEYLDIDNSIFLEGEVRERLWIYQNSHGDPSMHMLGNGLSVVKHSLITEAYCAETYAASVLLRLPDAQTVMPLRHEEHRNLRYD